VTAVHKVDVHVGEGKRRQFHACNRCVEADQEKEWESRNLFGPCEIEGDCSEPCFACGAINDVRVSDPHYRPHLFSLTDAYTQIKSASGAADTAIAASKLAGKLFANVGVITAKIAWSVVQNAPEITERMKQQIEKNKARGGLGSD
jgi:hypothetical protein